MIIFNITPKIKGSGGTRVIPRIIIVQTCYVVFEPGGEDIFSFKDGAMAGFWQGSTVVGGGLTGNRKRSSFLQFEINFCVVILFETPNFTSFNK